MLQAFATYLTILGALTLTCAIVYLLLRLTAWCEGRSW